MRLATRPAGPHLFGPTNIKVKGIMHILYIPATRGWVSMWDEQWDWEGWMKKGIDRVAGMGANTVKLIGLGPWSLVNGTFPSYLLDRVRQALDYTASIGLYVYWQTMMSDQPSLHTDAQRLTAAVESAKFLRDYPHVIGVDFYNEYGGQYPAFHQYVFAEFKAVAPNIPSTISYFEIPQNLTSTILPKLADYVDFWDIHAYNPPGGTSPQPSTLTAFRAWTGRRGKPYLIGEAGSPRSSGSSFAFGPAEQQAHWTRLQTISNEADCLGVVGFSLTDYDSFNFGVFAQDLVAPKPEMSVPFTWWRDVR